MNVLHSLATLLFAAVLLPGCSREPPPAPADAPPAATVQWPQVAAPIAKDPQLEAKIAALLSQLTLEQKIGQMVQPDIRDVTPEDVRKYRLGSILNGGGAFPGEKKYSKVSDWVALADRFYDASMDTSGGAPAIPILWGTDAVHGHNNVIGATLFPHNIGLGAANDPVLMERIGAAAAVEVAVTGIDWTFAPTVAVVRDDRWGRTYEGFSEDPEIVRAYAGPMVRGIQGAPGSAEFLDSRHVIATAKHYIGDGGTDQGIDRGDNTASEQALLDIHAQGYLTALEAGVQTVMASYNSWQGLKLHGHKYLLTDVLKDRLGFDGFVISDWDGIDEVQGCSKDKCAQAINAGVDMIMVPKDWKNFIANTVVQVQSGDIPQARIDDAVARILRVKLRAGLFEKGRPSSRPLANKTELLGAAEHRAIARQAVSESLVLLKNRNGVLPLRRDLKVLVAGAGADNIAQQSGGWTISWQGDGNTNKDFPGATSLFAGIKSMAPQAVLSVDGSYRDKPDVAIVVFGEEPYAEWHGNVKTVDYRGSEEALLRKLKSEGIPVVSVLLSGRPLWVNPELNASDAFVAAWLPGTEGGGVADVLFRDAQGGVNGDFRGKLSFSWPRSIEQTAVNRNDADYAPLFAYGFGLTYADKDTLGDDLPVATE
ncbi:MAG TPA: glycoside hydrolase family 3 protein [Povalibacter sp.]|uniref:glycoside hydrolase family 3 protein n=1 Tax=Povalibacter sp. TaxID=1962978 RepID=UPI002C72BC44|nr:glycoside hydrolase family 3 protein [Povalibacter sp.]HMN46617.1 glycoside hydrolase family 3 protein [Povalibacter sp.]